MPHAPPLSTRRYFRAARILKRIPLRLGLAVIRPIALISHRAYMRMLLPQLKAAGMTLTGTPRYISPLSFIDDFNKITLGDRVVVSSGVSFLTHDYSLTTALLAAQQFDQRGDVAIVRPITIGNNVFVGRGALLMPGTTIDDNVIVGAGAVVRGKVPAGSVVIGNPATRITTVTDLALKYSELAGTLDIRKDV